MRQPQLFETISTRFSNVFVGTFEYDFRGMVMSHMASPDLDLLHQMADELGLKRAWFQDKEGYPHYDVSKSKKQQAIKLGATEINDRELIIICYPKELV